MNRIFRRYHRIIAIALFLPLLLTVATGLLVTVLGEWLNQRDMAEFVLRVHTLEIFHLEGIYPILTGLGLLGLLITGLTMTGLFRTPPKRRSEGEG
jgi:hypothetical protein